MLTQYAVEFLHLSFKISYLSQDFFFIHFSSPVTMLGNEYFNGSTGSPRLSTVRFAGVYTDALRAFKRTILVPTSSESKRVGSGDVTSKALIGYRPPGG